MVTLPSEVTPHTACRCHDCRSQVLSALGTLVDTNVTIKSSHVMNLNFEAKVGQRT